MADHADHHHAVEQKPAPGVAMGIGLFVGMAALLVGFVGAIRASESMLTVGAVLAVIAIACGVVGVIIAKATGGTTRGFAVVLFLSVLSGVLWAVVVPQI